MSSQVGEATAGPLENASGMPRPDAVRATAPALPLVLTLAILALTYWCVDTVSPALPVMRDDLRLSATGAGFVVAFFFGGRLVANLPAAIFVTRGGPRWTALIGAVALLAGSLLVGMAAGEPFLLPARAVQGAGVALLATAGLLSVLRALPGGGSAMTAFNVASGVGSSGGLLVGGILTSTIGWRSIFWLSAGIAGLLFAGALSARPIAAAGGATRASPPNAALESAPPLRGATAAACVANLLVYCNYAIWVVALPLYANGRFGATAEQIGVLLLIVNAIHLLAAFPAWRIIRRAGAPAALGLGFATTGIGLALALATPTAGWLWAPMAVYAVGQVAGNSAAGDLILRLGGGGGRAVG
ncbi:MAG TPA: MFS transporter, partial [Thermomicrobiales bacterium]|nr:MFS transporter [Thermomicrobiales bacterium]